MQLHYTRATQSAPQVSWYWQQHGDGSLPGLLLGHDAQKRAIVFEGVTPLRTFKVSSGAQLMQIYYLDAMLEQQA